MGKRKQMTTSWTEFKEQRNQRNYRQRAAAAHQLVITGELNCRSYLAGQETGFHLLNRCEALKNLNKIQTDIGSEQMEEFEEMLRRLTRETSRRGGMDWSTRTSEASECWPKSDRRASHVCKINLVFFRLIECQVLKMYSKDKGKTSSIHVKRKKFKAKLLEKASLKKKSFMMSDPPFSTLWVSLV